MENAVYVVLSRQSGLLREMQVVANNIANLSTTGFRKEGVIFAEHVAALEGVEPDLAMASAEGRVVNLAQGPLTETGGRFDLAIEGEGFFLIETPGGTRLTRAGSFTPSAEGEVMTPDGHRLLDAGGAPVFVAPNARDIAIASDGTLSIDGVPQSQIGIFRPSDPGTLRHEGGTRFSAAETEPAEGAKILQGFLEQSNVNPIHEITRMIEVQRAYEMGQSLLDREDQRIRAVISALSR